MVFLLRLQVLNRGSDKNKGREECVCVNALILHRMPDAQEGKGTKEQGYETGRVIELGRRVLVTGRPVVSSCGRSCIHALCTGLHSICQAVHMTLPDKHWRNNTAPAC